MAISIVRLGSPRASGEGLRIGTVRRPPRGVPKADWARRDFYDVWLPTLAPSEALLKLGQAAESDAQWKTFKRRYLAEMKDSDKSRLLDTFPDVQIIGTRCSPCRSCTLPSAGRDQSGFTPYLPRICIA